MYYIAGQHLLRRNLVRRVSVFPKLTEPEAYRQSRLYQEISYQRYGKDPKEALSYHSDPLIDDLDAILDENEKDRFEDGHLVRVEMMHAPWNPADVNTVQGRYPSPYGSSTVMSPASGGPDLLVASDRCIGSYFENDPVIGSEGWGRVTHSSSQFIPKGTLVAMGLPALGTLRSSLWVPSSAVLPVSDSVHERLGPAGCSLFQLGGTALRLLSDFVELQPGDVVLQNAGNSGVGFLASQLAASSLLFGSNSGETNKNNNESSTPRMVSLIRRHGRSKESFEHTVDHLTRVGKNAFVVAEEDLFLPEDTSNTSTMDRSKGKTINRAAIREMRQRLRDLSPTGSLPKLALNAVGGETAKAMLKLLEPNVGSTMVTYGGMSGKGFDLATPQLIFSDVRAVGYWHSRWMVRQHEQEQRENHREVDARGAMVDTLSKLVLEEDLKCPPARVVRLEDLHEGLLWHDEKQSIDPSSHQSPIRRKLVWDCSE